MSVKFSKSPQDAQLKPEDVVMELPAVFTNHFHAMAGPDLLRLVYAETSDSQSFHYRGAIVCSLESARALAKLLNETVDKVEAKSTNVIVGAPQQE